MMSEAQVEHDQRREQTIAAVATFAALMHARERDELPIAADAQAEMERLGVKIRFIRPQSHRRDRELARA